LLSGEAACDGHLAVGNRRLHGGRGVLDPVEHDGNLALRGSKLGGDVGEDLGALGVERDIDLIGSHGGGRGGHGAGLDVGAVHEGGVGALLERHVVSTGRDLRESLGIADVLELHELEVARLADGRDRLVGVRGPRNLHENGVGPLQLNGGLGGAERVHALLDDALAVSMSDEDTEEPSDLLAVRITETPPWMSRPCVMRSERGARPYRR